VAVVVRVGDTDVEDMDVTADTKAVAMVVEVVAAGPVMTDLAALSCPL
jgi:hypothetical protein